MQDGETLYSPIWDIHLATWKDGFERVRITSFTEMLTNPGLEAANGLPHPASGDLLGGELPDRVHRRGGRVHQPGADLIVA